MKKVERTKAFGRGSTIFFKRRPKANLIVDTTHPRIDCIETSTNATCPASPTIGWDDVKCRPIFKNAVFNSVPLISSDESDSDDAATTPKCPDASVKGDEDDDEHWPSKKRRKMFGFRNRRHFFPETATTSISTTTSNDVLKSKCVMSPEKKQLSCFLVDTITPFASPHSNLNQNEDCICNIPLEDASWATINNSTEPTQKITEQSSHDQRSQRKQPARVNKRSRSSKESTMLSRDTQTPSTTVQPNSTTNLSAAKAFFDHLDATIQLQIIDASSASPTNSGSNHNISTTTSSIWRHGGRSMGPPNLRSPKLQQEYRCYQKASRESGVTPLSLKVYVQHRATIFRPKDMFDGFLDE